jgi:hypothetical protein
VRVDPARLVAVVANLLDRFHLTLAEIGRLTDFQVYALYFHKRDDKGNIPIPGGGLELRAPDRPLSLEEELMMLDRLAIFGRWKEEYTLSLKDQLRKRFAEKAGGVNGA